jgi:hypothetical protein
MRILSIDPATKNLGVCLVNYNENWISDVEAIMAKGFNLKMYDEINTIMNSMLKIEYINCFDMVPGKSNNNITVEERLSGAKRILNHIQDKINISNIILVEYQMGQNHKSNAVTSAILTYILPIEGKSLDAFGNEIQSNNTVSYIVRKVGPSLKNKYSFTPDLSYNKFLIKYARKTANKKHPEANFRYFLKTFNQQGILKGFSWKKMYDISDSFMMTYNWLVKYGVFTIKT